MIDSNIDLPVRSADGQAALDIFYNEFNDVNFYIEDHDQENLYEHIFRKMFPNTQISRIFPLNGKDNVLKHAKDPLNATTGVKRVYLLDKDFDDFLGEIFVQDNVFYLDRYCIENFLLEPDAIIEVIIENHPRKKRSDISTNLSLNLVIDKINKTLKPLFILFYCSQFFQLGIKNCKSKPEEFCIQTQLWQINNLAVTDYQQLIINTAITLGITPPLMNPLTDIRTNCVRLADAHSVVSGKFLLAIIFHYVKSQYTLSSTLESFIFRVAKNSSLRSMDLLATKIRSSLGITC